MLFQILFTLVFVEVRRVALSSEVEKILKK